MTKNDLILPLVRHDNRRLLQNYHAEHRHADRAQRCGPIYGGLPHAG